MDAVPISSERAEVERYFALPGRAHSSHPCWIHPDYGIQRRLLDGSSAFRTRAEAAAWIVDDCAEAAAFQDHRYGGAGLIGLVEAVPGETKALRGAYEAAEAWLADRGATSVRVPIAGHVLYGFGFLAEGYDRTPVVGTTWSPPEAIRATEAAGYRPARRFLNYSVPLSGRAIEAARAAPLPDGVTVVRIDRLRFRDGILTLARLRNRTFTELWGDAEMHSDEAWELLRRMRPVLVSDFALVAYAGGEPVGFVLGFPDFNQAFAPLGREPRGLRAAAALAARRRIRRGAIGEVGVVPEHRGRGLAAALVARVMLAMAARRYDELHYLLVLEQNAASRRTIERFGGRIYSSHLVLEQVV